MTTYRFLPRKAKHLIRGIAVLVVLTGVVFMASAQGPTIRYTFEPNGTPADNLTVAGGIHNRGSAVGHDGTDISLGAFTQFVPGPMGNTNAIHLDGMDSGDSSSGSGITTNTTTGDPDVNILVGPFTVMAWVKRDDFFGDHMVFGTGFGGANDNPDSGGNGSLHLGFRDTAIYMGFWGNDSNAPGIMLGEWHHVAWRFDGVGTQDILLDGEVVGTDPTRSPYLNDFTLLIGRQVFNRGAFEGSLSDVRIYNVFLANADVATIAASPP